VPPTPLYACYLTKLTDYYFEDVLQHMINLAPTSEESHRPYILWILRHFLSNNLFHILPPSSQQPYNPTTLPHSFIIRKDDERIININQNYNPDEPSSLKPLKGKGSKSGTRPSRDHYGRAKWQMLSSWVDERAGAAAIASSIPRNDSYDTLKAELLDTVPEDVERSAERAALAKLKTLASASSAAPASGTDSEGLERFQSILDRGKGILRDDWDEAT
jgi:hypothetical protein